MTHVLVRNNKIVAYPYSVERLRNDNPRVGFPTVMVDRKLAEYGMFPVLIAERPTPAMGETAVPSETPELVEGQWVLGWTVRAKTPEEVAAERDAMSVPRGQFAVAAAGAGLVTEQEALNWAGGNSLPATVNAVIDALPQAEQLPARVEALTALNVQRVHPLVLMLQASLGLTDEQTDGLFA